MPRYDAVTAFTRMTTCLKYLSRHNSQAGLALVEFTLVLPLLLLVLFGTLDFGRAFNYWNDQTHLAGEGARFAAVNKSLSPSLQQYIQQQADTSELRNGGTPSVPVATQVCVDFPEGTSEVGDAVRVKVKTQYHLLGFVSSKIGGPLSVNLESTATMRIEQKPTNYAANPC